MLISVKRTVVGCSAPGMPGFACSGPPLVVVFLPCIACSYLLVLLVAMPFYFYPPHLPPTLCLPTCLLLKRTLLGRAGPHNATTGSATYRPAGLVSTATHAWKGFTLFLPTAVTSACCHCYLYTLYLLPAVGITPFPLFLFSGRFTPHFRFPLCLFFAWLEFGTFHCDNFTFATGRAGCHDRFLLRCWWWVLHCRWTAPVKIPPLRAWRPPAYTMVYLAFFDIHIGTF